MPIVDRLRAGALALLTLLTLLTPGVARSTAHDAPTDVAKATTKKGPEHPYLIRHPLPFKLGERLVYDVKFSRFPIHASVGELTFTVGQAAGSAQHVKFEVGARSKGALTSLFNVSVDDVLTALADRDDLFVYSSIKNIDENDERRREESVFDRKSHTVRYAVSNPAAPSQPATVTSAETNPWIQDVVSVVYFVRTRKFVKDREVNIPLSDEGKTYWIGVAPLAREEVKTDVGTFKTIKLDGRIFNGRYVRRDGQLFVWVTDDARHIPVKAWLKVPAGSVTFELTTLEEGTTAILPANRNVTEDGEE